MRLTRETLLKIARDTASQRARVSRRIICIYLTGSVLSDAPLLGNTTDIDLVIIHDSEPLQPREIVRLNDEVHLDISHYPQSMFHQPRHLRTDPWLGPFIYSKPLVLHDTQHWFDFAQAATGAQFFQPDYVLQRANALAQTARQAWMQVALDSAMPHPRQVYGYLKALENAGNALVSLTGECDPLTERRFLLHLPHRVQALGRPELVSGLVSLLVPDTARLEAAWPHWMSAWKEAYTAASSQPDAPARLHPARMAYYERGAAALWEQSPAAAAWLLMRSWTLAASHLPGDAPALSGWDTAIQALDLDPAHFTTQMEALDHYLDQVEEALDRWAGSSGLPRAVES